jgi:hypothetical protein
MVPTAPDRADKAIQPGERGMSSSAGDMGGGSTGGDGGGGDPRTAYTLKVQLAGHPRPNLFEIAGGVEEFSRLRMRAGKGGFVTFDTPTHSIALNFDHVFWANFLEDYGVIAKGTTAEWKLPVDGGGAVGLVFAGLAKPVVVNVEPDPNSPSCMAGKKISEDEFDDERSSGWNFLMHFMIALDVHADGELDVAFLSFPDVDGEMFYVNLARLQLAVVPLAIEGNADCIEKKPNKRGAKKK